MFALAHTGLCRDHDRYVRACVRVVAMGEDEDEGGGRETRRETMRADLESGLGVYSLEWSGAQSWK